MSGTGNTTFSARDRGTDGDELQQAKRALQDQRRRATILSADVQRQIEAREAVEVRLMELQDELRASQDRRKEMARVIGNLKAQLEERYAELAALQRHMARTPTGLLKSLFGKRKRNG